MDLDLYRKEYIMSSDDFEAKKSAKFKSMKIDMRREAYKMKMLAEYSNIYLDYKGNGENDEIII